LVNFGLNSILKVVTKSPLRIALENDYVKGYPHGLAETKNLTKPKNPFLPRKDGQKGGEKNESYSYDCLDPGGNWRP